MRRLLFCLPLCMLMAPNGPRSAAPPDAPLADVTDDGAALPTEARMKRLAETDPVAFLETCIRRYDREVKGFHCILHKQERLEGTLKPSEVIDLQFREDPFSVRMKWKQGAGLAQEILYVKGENKDKILVKGTGLLALAGVVERDTDSPDAKQTSRYPVTTAGLKIGMQRTLTSWRAAQKDNALHVELLGEFKVKEAGDRVCWKLRRTGYRAPEDGDGATELTVYVDKETWIQVGSSVKNADGQLLGEYFFTDIELNPTFKPDTFTREGLGR